MLQGFLCRDALMRIVDEDLFQEVDELAVKRCVIGNDILVQD